MHMAGQNQIKTHTPTDILPIRFQRGMMKALIHHADRMMQGEYVKILGRGFGESLTAHFKLRATQTTLHQP